MEIALVGNPNSGKTTIFNALTGARQRVGNWSGVTVERKSGVLCLNQQAIDIIDLPGIYSLAVSSDDQALDERVANQYLLTQRPDLVINIVDASHMERSLYLTLQLLEMQVPVILAVNMLDVAAKKHITVDLQRLSQLFACPVIGMTANKKQGLTELKRAIAEPPCSATGIATIYPQPIEQAILTVCHRMQTIDSIKQLPCRWLALRLFEEDVFAHYLVPAEILPFTNNICQQLSQELSEDLDILIADARYMTIQKRLQHCVHRVKEKNHSVSQWLDKIVLNRIIGIPVFFLVMYAMFVFAINVGGVFQDFFDILANTFFVEGLSHVMISLHFPHWLTGLAAMGIGKGIATILTFIPVIGAMFLALSFLESSGYMARAAFVMDRVMRAIGLPGKSFVPMIIGFGCNVPAVLATRTLESRRDRILTIMMSPFMSCGARLAIYTVFITAFFPSGGQNIVFLLYFIGVIMAVLTGLLLRKTILPGVASPLVMELPSYHMPTLKSLWFLTVNRLRNFIVRAGKIIIPLCMLIGVLNSVTIHGGLALADGDQDSFLSAAGKAVTPIFQPMGITKENWPATVGIATGMLAKEVVVGTLNTLYSQINNTTTIVDEEPFSVWSGVVAAFSSIKKKIEALPVSLKNPVLASKAATEMEQGTFGKMYHSFGSQAAAFAYLLFLLLYFPCVSTTAVMLRELNRAWTVFSVCWTTSLAYATAVIFYQIATFTLHPIASSLWITMLITLFFSTILTMRLSASSNKSISAIPGVP